MPFSSRSLLSLARTAIRLLTRPEPGSGTGTSPRTGQPRTRSTPARPKSAPSSPARKSSVPKSSAPKSSAPKPVPPKPASKSGGRSAGTTSSPAGKPAAPGTYPGDYRGKVTPVYAPSPDGAPDPGEVVWAWVPYEDDYSQGKDRPVLLIGRSGSKLLALMMTTRDRNNARESDPDYVDVGSGPWDAQGRPSEVKLDRVLQLDPAAVRRQGSVMSAAAFQRVAQRFSARN